MSRNFHSANRITIAVSSCLLGDKIRYDGKDKYNKTIATEICGRFNCMPICPEYAIGLGAPRTPIQLVKIENTIKVLAMENHSLNLQEPLIKYAQFISETFTHICGYVFKARSPSCGLHDTPIIDSEGNVIAKGSGAYALQIILMRNNLPVIDEIQLENTNLKQEFMRSVEDYFQSALSDQRIVQ